MSNNDWVQEGTPREADDWGREQDDYGVPVETTEWDDYSSEQTVPVPTPPQQLPEEPVTDSEPTRVEEPEEAGVAAEPVQVEDLGDEAEVAEEVSVEEPEEAAAVAGSSGDGEPAVDEALAAEEPEPTPEPLAPSEPVAAQDPDQTTKHAAFIQPDGDEIPDEESPAVESATEAAPVEDSAPEEDPDRTAVHAAFTAPEEETVSAPAPAIAGLYREGANEQTQVIGTDAALAAEAAEEAQRDEQLRLEKEARDQRLGMVVTSDANALRDPNPPRRPGLGGFGSFGALVLRLVLAFVLGVSAWQILGDIDAATNYLGQTVLPYPREIAWGLGFTLAAMAVMLLLGFGVRVAGFLLAAIAGCALAFLRWGPFPIFAEGVEGFRGDKELIVAAVGILLFTVGGGKVGIDGAISTARWNAKYAKRP